MLDPTGIMAVVNGFIAFFNAMQSAIEYLRDILEIVDRTSATLAAVAAGNIEPGAAMLEQGLAAACRWRSASSPTRSASATSRRRSPRSSAALRELVDKALDWLIEQAMRLGQAALDALGLGGEAEPADAEPAAAEEEGAIHEPFDLVGQQHEIYTDASGALMVASNGGQAVPDSTS